MKRSILVADDNHICVESICQSLPWEELGIRKVDAVYDGCTAIEFIRNHPVDILLSDISMPGMDGLELAEAALKINPALKIVFISAYDEFEYARKAVLLGAYDYIEKPLDYPYLIELLKKVLQDIERDSRNLEIIKNSMPALRESFFRSLLQPVSKRKGTELQTYADYLDVNMNCRFCTILVLQVEDISINHSPDVEEYYVRMLGLEERIRETCSLFSVHYVLRDLQGFICFIGDDATSENNWKKTIVQSFSKLAEERCSNLSVTIGLGLIVRKLEHLPRSYSQALHALEYRFFFPEQTLLEAGTISGNSSDTAASFNVYEDELIQCISRRDMEGIEKWVHGFSNSFSGNSASKNLVYARLYSLISRLLKYTYELDLSDSEFTDELKSAFMESDRFNSIDKVAQWILEISRRLCAILQASVSGYHQGLCEAAARYIADNYQNGELSLSDIAEHIQITPGYLSTLFKQYRHENISNYITDVRIEASCQLLKQTNLSLKTISTQVGYSNQYYFSSCFKKKMGVTPSAYREGVNGK